MSAQECNVYLYLVRQNNAGVVLLAYVYREAHPSSGKLHVSQVRVPTTCEQQRAHIPLRIIGCTRRRTLQTRSSHANASRAMHSTTYVG